MKLKDELLIQLENHQGEEISGQELADKFNVSRNAIWKNINSLKEEGIEIESTKKGYILAKEYNKLSSNIIKRHLDDQSIDVITFDTIDSTNTEARRRITKDSKFLLVSANQTGGRGRNGKQFLSISKDGVYFSLALPIHSSFEDITKITTYTALCINKGIKEVAGIDTKIKWVNDIYLNKRKVCGILTEAISDFELGIVTNIIIGIGINVHENNVPEELKGIAGFLSDKYVDRNLLVATIVNELLHFEERKDIYIEEYKKNSLMINQPITYIENGINYDAISIDIDKDGGLVVKDNNGDLKTLRSGEVSIKIK